MAGRTLKIVYTGDAAGVQKTLGTIDKAHASTSAKLKSLGSSMVSAGKGMSLALTVPFLLFGKVAVDEFTEVNQVNGQTAAALKSTGGAANVTMGDIQGLAKEVGKLAAGGKLVSVIGSVISIFKTLGAVLAANPYLLLIGATIALVALIIANWDKVKAFLLAAWNAIKAAAIAVWNAITGAISSAVNAVKAVVLGVWSAAKAGVTMIWNGVMAVAVAIWNGIKAVITTAVNLAKAVVIGVWTAAKAGVTTIWNGIKAVATTIWNGIKAVITASVNAVKTIVIGVMSGLKTTWTAIWGGIKAVAVGAWNGIVAVAKGALNAIIGVVNGFIGALNTAANAIDTLLGPWINFGDIPQVPKLAGGTRNWQGGLAIVGDAGPELVNLPAGAQVTPAGETRRMIAASGLEAQAGFAPAAAGPTFVDARTILHVAGSVVTLDELTDLLRSRLLRKKRGTVDLGLS